MAATAESIQGIIRHRLTYWNMMDALVEKHGQQKVDWAIEDASYFYAGCEEIGSSDANYMVDSAVRSLGEPTIFKN